MKSFHRLRNRSADIEKKSRKVNNYRNDKNSKCLASQIHCHDCPVIRKSCPIHERESLEEKCESNVTISFHPSSKTEKLFHPVKKLLSHCSPETKINFQYYSPRKFTEKENTKNQFIQTSLKDIPKACDNVSVEKTKSSVSDKTNKMKKLKQCFQSPCNSIPYKTQSHSSFAGVFRENARQTRNTVFGLPPQELPDEAKYPNAGSDWISSEKLGFKCFTDEKGDSDYITVTQQKKNNIINHKIFEIQHKNHLNEVPFPKQTQFVYSAANFANSSKNPNRKPSGKRSTLKKYSTDDEREETDRKGERMSTSENSRMSSSSQSIYFTPFFLMPTGLENSENETRANKPEVFEDNGVANQVKEQKNPTVSVETQTIPEEDEDEKVEKLKKSPKNAFEEVKEPPATSSVLIQTEPLPKCCSCTKEIFINDFELSEEFVEKKTAAHTDANDIKGYKWPEIQSDAKNSDNFTRTIEVQQSSGYRYKKILKNTRWETKIKDEECQTESDVAFEKTIESVKLYSEKLTQTIENPSPMDLCRSYILNESDFCNHLQSSYLNIEKMSKTYKVKNVSDTVLYKNKKCICSKIENTVTGVSPCLCTSTPQLSNERDFFTQTDEEETLEFKLKSSERVCTNIDSGKPVKLPKTISRGEQTSFKEGNLSAAISDLSELKKIIQEFFVKADPSLVSTECECDLVSVNEQKVNVETMTTTSFLKEPQKTANATVQTSVHVLLDEAIEETPDVSKGLKIKIRQSVLLDTKNQTKTYFVCAVCGRELNKSSVNAGTNTENVDDRKIKEKVTVIDTTYSEIKKIKANKRPPGASKGATSSSKPNEIPKFEHPKPIKQPQTSVRTTCTQPKSSIPLPVTCIPPPHKAFTFGPDFTKEKLENCHPKQTNQKPPVIPSTFKSCECKQNAETSTREFSKPGVSNTAGPSKTKPTRTSTKPDELRNRGQHIQRTKERHVVQNRKEFILPVIVKQFWPESLLWNSVDDSNSIFSKQKRSYEKDLETIDSPVEKKIKAADELTNDFFIFGKPDNPKGNEIFTEKTRFIWLPPSTTPFEIRTDLSDKVKNGKSGDAVPNQPSVFKKNKNKDGSTNLFTVKSCHLKPFAIDDDSSNKLLQCSFCKSLTVLKAEKNEILQSNSNTMIACQYLPPGTTVITTNEEPIEKLSSSASENIPGTPDESSDDHEIYKNLENNSSRAEIIEVLEKSSSSFFSPGSFFKSRSHGFNTFDNTDVADTSRSLNTFWFGNEERRVKKRARKHRK